MKKLLHERLREWNVKADKRFLYPGTVAECEVFDDISKHDNKTQMRLFEWFADEIERDYIPRNQIESEIDSLICDLNNSYEKSEKSIPCNRKGLKIVSDRLIHIRNNMRPSPVLDADGVEIKVGDTVWDRSNKEWRVGEISDSAHIYVYDSDENGDCRIAACLTHKEPDSLEKLRDDMAKVTEQKDVDYADMEAWINRLSALIERGK